ncbi:MAG: DUF1598 domain-containing protein, partial [Phycisphaerae bacterium]|nr:DUF1598 domain-containing protein [Phycisphaerae bacterium]
MICFETRCRAACFSLLVALLVLAPWSRSEAQLAAVGRGGAVAFDPVGVYIDPAGVLRSRVLADAKQVKALLVRAARDRRDPALRYVSLPRLFAAAREAVAAGKPLPDAIRYVGGLTRLKYVFVYPEENDLVIAGPAEQLEVGVGGRALGRLTGRPALQFDDLVVALRTCGPGRHRQVFGVNIEQTSEQMQRMMDALQRMQLEVKTQPRQRRAVAEAMADAAGPQTVRLINLAADTRFALVCLEADYLLKRLAIGLDRSPVPRVHSYLAYQAQPQANANRFWLETLYEPLLVSPDQRFFEIRGQSLQVRTHRQFNNDPAAVDPAADRFTTGTTRHFEAISWAIPSFADLANLSDLGLLAALIARHDLHDQAKWDLAWFLDPSGYRVARVPTPATARTLVNYHVKRKLVL